MNLAVITARGGSRRLPGKNLRSFCGRPLIWYSIQAARRARRIHRTLVSTDCERIARAARHCGAEVLMRPTQLATDEARSVDAVRHALLWAETGGETVDVAVLLQPTCPLRPPHFVDGALQMLLLSRADSAVSVVETRPKLGAIRGGRFLPEYEEGARKQDMAPRWRESGLFYATRRDVLIGKGSLFGERILPVITDPLYAAANIDYELDFQVAEQLYRTHRHLLGLEEASSHPVPRMEARSA